MQPKALVDVTEADDLRLYTTRETAKIMGVAEATIRKWVAAGVMTHRVVGSREKRFTRADMAAAIRALEVRTGSRWNTATPADERAS